MTHDPARCEVCVRTALGQGINPSTLREPVCGNDHARDPYR